MRPLVELRWIILAILLWLWPVEKPSEQELISYGREIERQKPKISPFSTGIHTIMYLNEHPELKQVHDEANAEQVRELQRHLESRRQSTEPIPLEKINSAVKLHAHHLRHVDTSEMEAMIDTEKRPVR